MKISIGNSRKTTKWKETDLTLNELFNRVSVPTVTNESFNTYLSLGKDQQDDLKDVGGFVGGRLRNGRRKKEDVLDRSLLALDADNLNSSEDLEGLLDQLNRSQIEFIVYSTRKHTLDSPRIRILIPFKEPIPPEAYEPLARKVCSDLGMSYFDPTTVDINRLMYFPSVSQDMQDQFFTARNLLPVPPLDGQVFLTQNYSNWKDQSEWPRFPNEEENIQRDVSIQQDPLTKEGIIGKFCQAYPISEAIAKFLPTIYEPISEDRYTYLKGSTAGGAVVYDDKFLYSHHATDPANTGHVCNSFDLVRIHKFGDKKDSLKEMTVFAADDDKVKKLLFDEDFSDFIDLVEEQEDDVSEEDKITFKEILEKLTKNKKGEYESTIDNILLILQLDPNLKCFYNDIFAERMTVTGPFPWINKNTKEQYPRTWNDSDDSGLRWYIERFYKITGVQKVMDATNLSFQNRPFHPVRDYIEKLEWDGKKRIETLLIDYFGAEDNVYTREVMRKSLTAAVARIFKPGVKFDPMTVLVGGQGIGKSTFLSMLGKEWFTDSLTEFTGKDSFELLQGNWIIEVAELNGMYNKESEQVKQFLSKRFDEYRAPYGKRKEVHPRQCVFFGTTNSRTFLKDQTGNRRFWPVQLEVGQPIKNIWKDLPGEVDQIWAEAYSYYVLGESLELSKEAEELAQIEQESRLEEDPRKGMIIEFLKKKVPENWMSMSLEDRKFYWLDPTAVDEPVKYRDRICAAEIHCELFNNPKATMDRRIGGELNRLLDSIKYLTKPKNKIRIGSDYGMLHGYYIEPEFFK